ncbi:MAG: hypothetical protein QGG02_08320 [Gammaproteobacteria bacterium]|jgi:hypothetical protein|nr:hypothetical protein [Gammaproteobacteria bacterium]MDP6731468.1 hypothetical protein [Gammaproteobacteria bacterium]
MVTRFKQAAIASALGLVAVLLAASSALAQTNDSYTAPRAWDGNPDINGVWQAIGTAHWDLQDHQASAGLPELGALGVVPPGQGIVVGNEIPYQPWALEQKQANWDNRQSEDPEAKCYLPGVPRATYLPYPFQILQGTNKIMIVYGYAEANRTIHMDKENPESAPLDTWMGRSHGKWEGDTLVVDAQGFNGQAWFDRAGNFASSALKVTERYTPISPDAMLYEATLEDPTVFTRPWQISMPLYRRLEANARVIEYKCVEFSEEILYGHLRKQTSE